MLERATKWNKCNKITNDKTGQTIPTNEHYYRTEPFRADEIPSSIANLAAEISARSAILCMALHQGTADTSPAVE